jgi:hypothetical protein
MCQLTDARKQKNKQDFFNANHLIPNKLTDELNVLSADVMLWSLFEACHSDPLASGEAIPNYTRSNARPLCQ